LNTKIRKIEYTNKNKNKAYKKLTVNNKQFQKQRTNKEDE